MTTREPAMVDQKRRYERIEIGLSCRLFIPEGGKDKGLKFEAFTLSQNLGLGGVFVESTFLLKPDLELWIELGLPTEALAIRGRVVHSVPLDHGEIPSGMGIEFLDVDSHAREVLLRYFTPERYKEFYNTMIGEFSHLEREFELQDASLMINLWEEWKVRISGGPMLTSSGAPEPTPRRKRR